MSPLRNQPPWVFFFEASSFLKYSTSTFSPVLGREISSPMTPGGHSLPCSSTTTTANARPG